MPVSNDGTSLNRVTDILKEVADCHKLINDFATGETASKGYNDKVNAELKYPYLWVDYESTNLNVAQGRISDKVYNMRLFIADKHYDNIKSEDEILSDTEGTLTDIVQWILTHPTLKKILIPVGTITLLPTREGTKDDVFGWSGVIPIRIPYKFCHTDLPIEPKA